MLWQERLRKRLSLSTPRPTAVQRTLRLQRLEDRSLLAINVFLDFTNFAARLDEAATAADVEKFGDKPDELATIQAGVISKVERLYRNWDINFGTSQPTGAFERVIFGQTVASVIGAAYPNALGIAGRKGSPVGSTSGVDFLNLHDDDEAFVFVERFDRYIDDPGLARAVQISHLIAAIGLVAAHELGHNFGLMHADAYGDPAIDVTATARAQNEHVMASGSATGMNEDEIEGSHYFSLLSAAKLDFATGIGASSTIPATTANNGTTAS